MNTISIRNYGDIKHPVNSFGNLQDIKRIEYTRFYYSKPNTQSCCGVILIVSFSLRLLIRI